MALETATYLNDLVTTNPVTGDNVSQGDDHLRLLKTVLQTTFPGADRAMPFPDTEAKTSSFSAVRADFNKTFLVDASGVVTRLDMTLPSLAAGDKGWKCHFVKTDTSTKPTRVLPASGTLQSGSISGLAATRRCIPGVVFTAHWTGSLWFVTRCIDVPVASVIEYDGATIPIGFEQPDDNALASVAANYPDYSAVVGSGAKIDRRGVIAMGKDNMGGGARGLLVTGATSFGAGANPSTLGQLGGDDQQTLLAANLPEHKHTITDVDHEHVMRASTQNATTGIPSANRVLAVSGSSDIYFTGAPDTDMRLNSVKAAKSGITETNNYGAATPTAFSRVQPTVVKNFLLVVE